MKHRAQHYRFAVTVAAASTLLTYALTSQCAVALAEQGDPRPSPIGEIQSLGATCEPAGTVEFSYVVVDTRDHVRMTLHLDPHSGVSFAEYYDARGRLLARLDVDGSETHASHTQAGDAVSRAVALSYARALVDADVTDAVDDCDLRYQCGGKVHKLLQGLCIASGVVCCATALPACLGCAHGAIGCVDKADSRCK